MQEIYTKLSYGPGREQFQPYVTFSLIFIGSLLVLHIYWFYLMLCMDCQAIRGDKIKDVQNDYTKMLKDGKKDGKKEK